MKYTETGSITVRCTSHTVSEGSLSPGVEIVVADTGCGISQTKLESIFREFERVESHGPKPSVERGVGELAPESGRVIYK